MFDTTIIDAQLEEAQVALAEAEAEASSLSIELERADLRDRFDALVRPQIANFDDPKTWREAVDAYRFQRRSLSAAMQAAETSQVAAFESVMDRRARLKTAEARCALVRAANEMLAGDPNFAEVLARLPSYQRAYWAYAELPFHLRAADGDFAEQMSVPRIMGMAMNKSPSTAAAAGGLAV